MVSSTATYNLTDNPGSNAPLGVRERVREMREERGWTRSEMARLAGMTPSHIQKLEDGRLKISLELMHKFARLFGVKMAALLPPEENDFSTLPEAREVLAAFFQLPADERPYMLRAAKEIGSLARSIAVRMSDGGLEGEPEIVSGVLAKWTNWSDAQRRQALDLLSAIERFPARDEA